MGLPIFKKPISGTVPRGQASHARSMRIRQVLNQLMREHSDKEANRLKNVDHAHAYIGQSLGIRTRIPA